MDGAGLHAYDGTMWWSEILRRPPTVPFAVPLASKTTGLAYLVCLDFDVHGAEKAPKRLHGALLREWLAMHGTGLGPAGVDEDVERALEWLRAAGTRLLAVQSSPAGGRHVWFAIPEGVDVELVKVLARALKALLPTLDTTMLMNPKTGCVRPPGAAHRRGGRAQIDTHVHRDPRAALEEFARGNDAGVVERILAVLPREAQDLAVSGKPGDRPVGLAGGYARIARDRRELSPRVRQLADTPLEPGTDASARFFSIALGAAFAGWDFAEFAALCEGAPGAVYAREARAAAGEERRVPRSAQAREALLVRQWERAVETARTMPVAATPAGEDGAEAWERRRQEIVRGVQAIGDRMALETWRWTLRSGPTDELVLLELLRRAEDASTLVVGASVRSLADEAGIAASTAALALERLATTCPVRGDRWIKLHDEHDGPNSAVWELLVPDFLGKYLPVDITRTQHTHPPLLRRAQRAPFSPQAALALSSHDLWHPHYGLGHHTSRTYTAIRLERDPGTSLTLFRLCALTGYTQATIHRHLRLLAQLDLIHLGKPRSGDTTVRASRRSLDAAAAATGAAGAGARRSERHIRERELWLWWLDELAWRKAPAATKPIGAPAAADLDHAFVPAGWAERDRRWAYGRIPTIDGRADWATARTLVNAAF